MAQGNKSRIVIWTIVGILVVIAAIMLITKPKNVDKLPVNKDRFVNTMTSKLDRLDKKVAAAQAEFPGAPAEQWQSITTGIAGVRQILADMGSLTEDKDLRPKVEEANKAYNAAKKVLKEITGKEEPDEGGQ